MTQLAGEQRRGSSLGAVLHAALAYDALVWMATLGRDDGFRQAILDRAHLKPGELVLDAGCGTGSLAIAAKRQVGPEGLVHGIDASPEMIARASRKAARAGLSIQFRESTAQALPFPDANFDVVLNTLMLHHLPRKGRQVFAGEVRRVLKPGGRLLAVDFAKTPREPKRLFSHFHRHGHVDLDEIASMLDATGLRCIESGLLGFRGLGGIDNLHYILAQA